MPNKCVELRPWVPLARAPRQLTHGVKRPLLAGSGQTILSTNGQSLLLCTPGYDPIDQADNLRQQHDVHAVGAVGAERDGLLDVGGARRTGNEIDRARHVSKFGA